MRVSPTRPGLERLVPPLVALLGLLLSACAPANVQRQAEPASPAPAVAQPAESPGVATGERPSGTAAQPREQSPFLTSLVEVADRVRPATVQITSELLRPDELSQPVPRQAGVGSGVIFDDQGHVLTNHHVIASADRLLVTLPDGRSFRGQLVGSDTLTDLAVVKVDAQDLPTAQLGNSDQLRVAETVMAIGNALGLPGGPTVTVGVVSALGRTIQTPPEPGQRGGAVLFDLIQTDAEINPGNSGGPLVNMNGEVVAINTIKRVATEGGVPVSGIGFAIAINTAKPIAEQLIATGNVEHPYVGIAFTTVNPALAAQQNLSVDHGAFVSGVVPGGPADQAGIQEDDVIVALNGSEIKTSNDLYRAILTKRPGDQVTFTVVRDGERQEIAVTLGTRPAEP